MRFYNEQHKYYCGIDLNARKMYLCIMNREGEILLHKKIAKKIGTATRGGLGVGVTGGWGQT